MKYMYAAAIRRSKFWDASKNAKLKGGGGREDALYFLFICQIRVSIAFGRGIDFACQVNFQAIGRALDNCLLSFTDMIDPIKISSKQTFVSL